MAAHTRQLVAYAHVVDVERSIRFYADLGFAVANQVVPDGATAPVWAWLQSDDAHLMVARASGPVDAHQQAVLFYLYVDDIGQAHTALQSLGHHPGAIGHPFYLPDGEFRMHDPDGYVLMLAQRPRADAQDR